jgi:sugar phosphate isomerase/epimerase
MLPTFRNDEGIRSLAPRLDAIGKRCHERGVTFAYHNHDFEFATLSGGATILDTLLAQTDPAYVQLELDVYWAAYAGVSPESILQHYTGRVPLLHLKDMTPDRHFAEVGDGTLHLAQLLPIAEQSGTRIYIVENDAPSIPSLESARRSLANLGNMA